MHSNSYRIPKITLLIPKTNTKVDEIYAFKSFDRFRTECKLPNLQIQIHVYVHSTYVYFQSICISFCQLKYWKLVVCDKLINSRSLSATGDHYEAADKSLLMAFALLHIYDLHISLGCLRRDQCEIKVLFPYPLTDYGSRVCQYPGIAIRGVMNKELAPKRQISFLI